MQEKYANRLYDTMAGLTEDGYGIPGVENIFAPGAPCDTLYTQAYEAGIRICQRLGVDTDPDVELIFQNLEEVSRILGCRMFSYGAGFSGS